MNDRYSVGQGESGQWYVIDKITGLPHGPHPTKTDAEIAMVRLDLGLDGPNASHN